MQEIGCLLVSVAAGIYDHCHAYSLIYPTTKDPRVTLRLGACEGKPASSFSSISIIEAYLWYHAENQILSKGIRAI